MRHARISQKYCTLLHGLPFPVLDEALRKQIGRRKSAPDCLEGPSVEQGLSESNQLSRSCNVPPQEQGLKPCPSLRLHNPHHLHSARLRQRLNLLPSPHRSWMQNVNSATDKSCCRHEVGQLVVSVSLVHYATDQSMMLPPTVVMKSTVLATLTQRA